MKTEERASERTKFTVILKDRAIKEPIGKNKIFLTGFHGIGAVGYLTTRYIADQPDSKHIGYILLDRLPLVVKMGDSRIQLPFELYKRKNFIIMVTESPPEPREMHLLTRGIAEWVIAQGFEEAVLIGGLSDKYRSDDEQYRVAYTSAYASARKIFGKLIDPRLTIFGPLASLLSYFELNEFPAITILPYARQFEPDTRATMVALNVLNEHYDAKINVESIRKEVEEIEARIEASMKESEQKVLDEKSREKFMFYM
ncbi:MAG: PAC2 family protein [Thermoprotei archaeon]